jgi:hypothetical protein
MGKMFHARFEYSRLLFHRFAYCMLQYTPQNYYSHLLNLRQQLSYLQYMQVYGLRSMTHYLQL